MAFRFTLTWSIRSRYCTSKWPRLQHTSAVKVLKNNPIQQTPDHDAPLIFLAKEKKLVEFNEKFLEELSIDTHEIKTDKTNNLVDQVKTVDEKVNDSNRTKTSSIFDFLKQRQKKQVSQNVDSTPPTIFSDEEPVDINSKSLVKLNHNDPTLWHTDAIDIKKLPQYYLMLSKSRLTLLVCLTSAAGYGLASSANMNFDPIILAVSTFGVGLTSASANSINQFLEVPFDSQMMRTRNRVLVKGILSPWHAMGFASVTALGGAMSLWYFVNPTASILAVGNLILYTSIYTPMKRLSILNTWVGSIVGAIPPIIGWVSATGTLDFGALVLGGILFTWQFPHFNSLSWNLRPDYSRAGYRMMSVTDPELCKRVALRHSVGCLLVCSVGAPMLDVTSLTFAVDSLPLNGYLIYLSWIFYKKADSSSSRKLFRYTLIHLPLLMILMFISRKRSTEQKTQ